MSDDIYAPSAFTEIRDQVARHETTVADAVWPDFPGYRATAAPREIPLFLLTRVP
ncbi:hypothetical protein [Actinocorallia longicatena]|uniref:SAM-dependent methyltransferase n=1 Tax=Actinocorallia longicatena TaxID=111803 RepID=A0ABP6Q3G3_9ACTN